MPLRSCTSSGCTKPADRGQGTCVPCHSHLSTEHLLAPTHACQELLSLDPDKYYDEYFQCLKQQHKRLVSKIDLTALQRKASDLRGGIACSIPALSGDTEMQEMIAAQTGGQNCHIDIAFEDGVIWIARIRLDDPIQAPSAIRDYVVRSEVATLHFLEQLPIPTSRVHHYTLSDDIDSVGVPYVLMDKLDGHPLNFNNLTQEQKSKVLRQLAGFSLTLRAHPFASTGSIVFDPGNKGVAVGPYALWQLWKNPSCNLGPYSSVQQAYQQILQTYLDFYQTGELDQLAIDNVLAIGWRMECLDHWYPRGEEVSGKFYLKHQDDTGSHILVNESFEITGIIDWEMATLEPQEYAFSSPTMLWPVGDFYDGKNGLSAEELELARIFEEQGEGEMYKFVTEGRRYQRFLFFLGGGSETQDEFVGLFKGMRRAIAELSDELSECSKEEDMAEYDRWKEAALEEANLHVREVLDAIAQRHEQRDSQKQ